MLAPVPGARVLRGLVLIEQNQNKIGHTKFIALVQSSDNISAVARIPSILAALPAVIPPAPCCVVVLVLALLLDLVAVATVATVATHVASLLGLLLRPSLNLIAVLLHLLLDLNSPNLAPSPTPPKSLFCPSPGRGR